MVFASGKTVLGQDGAPRRRWWQGNLTCWPGHLHSRLIGFFTHRRLADTPSGTDDDIDAVLRTQQAGHGRPLPVIELAALQLRGHADRRHRPTLCRVRRT